MKPVSHVYERFGRVSYDWMQSVGKYVLVINQ